MAATKMRVRTTDLTSHQSRNYYRPWRTLAGETCSVESEDDGHDFLLIPQLPPNLVGGPGWQELHDSQPSIEPREHHHKTPAVSTREKQSTFDHKLVPLENNIWCRTSRRGQQRSVSCSCLPYVRRSINRRRGWVVDSSLAPTLTTACDDAGNWHLRY